MNNKTAQIRSTALREEQRKACSLIESVKHRESCKLWAVLKAWNETKHLPLNRVWLRTEIAHRLGYQSPKTIWCIVSAYYAVCDGNDYTNTYSGYSKTWVNLLSGQKKDIHKI